MRATNTEHHDRGFTLVEVLIAIVLVGILSSVVVVAISALGERAGTASCEASADAARSAAAGFLVKRSTYPTTMAELTAHSESEPALLILPPTATTSGRTVVAPTWVLTMSESSPPTFTCASRSSSGPADATSASTTTKPSPTTATTTTGDNGVTATPGFTGDGLRAGENVLRVSNSAPITAMSVTITVNRDPGMRRDGQYATFEDGDVTSAFRTVGTTMRYSFDLAAGSTIVPGTWTVAAQWEGAGHAHLTSSDTWTITTTSLGRTHTLSGTF